MCAPSLDVKDDGERRWASRYSFFSRQSLTQKGGADVDQSNRQRDMPPENFYKYLHPKHNFTAFADSQSPPDTQDL